MKKITFGPRGIYARPCLWFSAGVLCVAAVILTALVLLGVFDLWGRPFWWFVSLFASMVWGVWNYHRFLLMLAARQELKELRERQRQRARDEKRSKLISS